MICKQAVKRFLFALALLPLLAAVSSCSNDRPVYQGAEYYKNLEVPPDLTEPDTAEQLRVPDPTEEALQRFRDNNKLETVITPKFDGVRVVDYAGNSWIEVDNTVEHVWPRLIRFWEVEGIGLVAERPLLGFMETEWVERLGPETGYLRSLFQGFEPDQKDKFRVRVQRFDDGRKTRLYISHARIEKVVSGEYEENYIWVSRPSDLEAEREIISRMSLFAGLSKPQTAELLQNYRPYTSLIKVDSRDTTAFTMSGSMDFVWRRSMRALDRMRMKDVQEQPENNTINFVVGEITDQEIGVEEDELSKSSWLMQLLTGSDDDEAVSKSAGKYRLEFREADGRVQVVVMDAGNNRSTDEDGDVYGSARTEQLRNILIKYME